MPVGLDPIARRRGGAYGLNRDRIEDASSVTDKKDIMNHLPVTIVVLALTAFAVGCKPSTEPSTTQPPGATAQQLDRMRTATQEAAQDIKDFTYTQKTEYVAHMQNQIDAINRDLDQIEARIEKADAAARAEAQPKLQALRDQAARLTRQLDEARSATESTWDDVKVAFKDGYGELKTGFDQARQWVSEKIAP